MLAQKEIIRVLHNELPYLKNNFGVKKIAIFGSFAKRLSEDKSDIDVLIEFNKPIGLRFVDLAEYLEKKFGRKIDILTPAGIGGIRIKKVARDIKRSLLYV